VLTAQPRAGPPLPDLDPRASLRVPPWVVLAAVALVLLLVDFWAFHRRLLP